MLRLILSLLLVADGIIMGGLEFWSWWIVPCSIFAAFLILLISLPDGVYESHDKTEREEPPCPES